MSNTYIFYSNCQTIENILPIDIYITKANSLNNALDNLWIIYKQRYDNLSYEEKEYLQINNINSNEEIFKKKIKKKYIVTNNAFSITDNTFIYDNEINIKLDQFKKIDNNTFAILSNRNISVDEKMKQILMPTILNYFNDNIFLKYVNKINLLNKYNVNDISSFKNYLSLLSAHEIYDIKNHFDKINVDSMLNYFSNIDTSMNNC